MSFPHSTNSKPASLANTRHWLTGPIAAFVFVGCVMLSNANCSAQEPKTVAPETGAVPTVINPKEQKIKAAYIYNFCKYFAWPDDSFEDASSPIVIGVLGHDSLGNQLDLLADRRTVKKRKIVIQRFETMSDYKTCHLLFIPAVVNQEKLVAAVEDTEKAPLLIVSGGHEPAEHGAAVTFFWKPDNTIGFEIDLNALARRKLEVSAKLLKIARVKRR